MAEPADLYPDGDVGSLPKKKRATFSSTAATLTWARKLYGDEAVGISSWWQSAGGIGGVRKDLLGFIDAVVLDGLPGVLALQATGPDVAEHKRKMEGAVRRDVTGAKRLKAEIDAAKLAGRVRRWLAAGNRILIVSWRDAWVETSERHKVRKKAPRFVEARLEPHPPGVTLGLSDRGLVWIEHETWPPVPKKHNCGESAPPGFLESGLRRAGERWTCPDCNLTWIHVTDEATGSHWRPAEGRT